MLKGHVVLVTGGGTGIGLYIAQGLADNGAKVYVSGRRKDVLEKAAQSFRGDNGGLLVPLEMDVNSKDSIRDAVKAIAEVDGKLDALVNNAGAVGTIRAFWANPASPERKDPFTLGTSLFEADSFSEWDSVFNANTASIYFMTLAFSELLQKGSNARADYSASVINITSCVGSSKLSSGFIPYAITKGAANHLTKLLAADFARRNMRVRVNAVAPGVFITEMSKPWMKNEENMTKEEATMISGSLLPLPAERAGIGQEIAGTALYLISSAGYYTNRQLIAVDGGFSLSNITTV